MSTDPTTETADASAPAIKPAPTTDSAEQVVTPWDVQGGVTEDGRQTGIDYNKLIVQFGTRKIDEALLERFERLTGHKPHVFLRRGMFFSHRYWIVYSHEWTLVDNYLQGI